nr:MULTISPECIES: arabinan endo-1,5-alpha-L-arabinosidase [unclassified Actinomyces]
MAVFSTGDPAIAGGAVLVRVSEDGGTTWGRRQGAWSFSDEPGWTHETVPGLTSYWAPDVVRVGDEVRLYYSASTFGSSRSAIGLMVNTAFDPADPSSGWQDRGPVLTSGDGEDYNAIDPSVITDAEGRTWMAFGSFWGGVFAVELGEDGLRLDPQAPPVLLADRGTDRNDVEGAALARHDGAYYLFLSFGTCCQGTGSTYEIAVGRSQSVTGPYADRDGVPLTQGGGTILLSTAGSAVGPGGESVAGDWLVHHYYDADAGGLPTLSLRRMAWEEGWPVLTSDEEQRDATGD